MNVRIQTNTSKKIEALTEITAKNQQMYAQRHGYDWRCDYFEYDTPGFNQNALESLHKLKQDIQEVDILMTVGADVMFMNQLIRIQDIVQAEDKVVVARERTAWWPINNDVVLWVNKPETLALVDRFIADFHIWEQYQWRLQQHLWNLIQLDPQVRQTVRLVDDQVMNRHPTRWQLGDYIVHFYGMPIEEKVAKARHMTVLFPNFLPVYGGVNVKPVPDVD